MAWMLLTCSHEHPSAETVVESDPQVVRFERHFNIIAGLLAPDAGTIHGDGAAVSNLRGRVGYMMQKDLLFPWRTVISDPRFSEYFHALCGELDIQTRRRVA